MREIHQVQYHGLRRSLCFIVAAPVATNVEGTIRNLIRTRLGMTFPPGPLRAVLPRHEFEYSTRLVDDTDVVVYDVEVERA